VIRPINVLAVTGRVAAGDLGARVRGGGVEVPRVGDASPVAAARRTLL
jgi:hypothetical protein